MSARPRQAYYALKNLTTSSLTQGNGTTDSDGSLRSSGLGGNYSLIITAPGFESTQTTVHVKEQSLSQFEVRMQKASAAATSMSTLRSTTGGETVSETGTGTTASVSLVAGVLTSQTLAIARIALLTIVAVGAFYLRRRRK